MIFTQLFIDDRFWLKCFNSMHIVIYFIANYATIMKGILLLYKNYNFILKQRERETKEIIELL